MIIDDKRQGNTTLDELCNGDIFEAKFDGERGFFIKTDERYEADNIMCVDLCTGEMCGFPRDNKVTLSRAKLVIEG